MFPSPLAAGGSPSSSTLRPPFSFSTAAGCGAGEGSAEFPVDTGGPAAGKEWSLPELMALVGERPELEAGLGNGQLKELRHHSYRVSIKKSRNTYKHLKSAEAEEDLHDGKIHRFFTEFETLGHYSIQRCTSDDGNCAIGPSRTGADTAAAYEGDIQKPAKKKRNRSSLEKLFLFLESLMKQVMDRQEEMHQQLMEALEKRENDRIIREDAWRKKQIEMTTRDIQERLWATSRDLAIVSFLEKFSGQQIHIPEPAADLPHPKEDPDESAGAQDISDQGSKRWKTSEALALIRLRIAMDDKFRSANQLVCSLWEEISKTMSSLGYSRSWENCREKWLGLNKYFKKVSSSNKHWPEDSKHHLCLRELELFYRTEKPNDNNL